MVVKSRKKQKRCGKKKRKRKRKQTKLAMVTRRLDSLKVNAHVHPSLRTAWQVYNTVKEKCVLTCEGWGKENVGGVGVMRDELYLKGGLKKGRMRNNELPETQTPARNSEYLRADL